MRDLEQLEKKSLQTNKTTVTIQKKKSVVIPSTAERKSTGTTGTAGSSGKNVNY
jgi:hypothetical protein